MHTPWVHRILCIVTMSLAISNGIPASLIQEKTLTPPAKEVQVLQPLDIDKVDALNKYAADQGRTQLSFGIGFLILLVLFLIHVFLKWDKIVGSGPINEARFLVLSFLMAVCAGAAGYLITGGSLVRVQSITPTLSIGITATAGAALFIITFITLFWVGTLTARQHRAKNKIPGESTRKDEGDSVNSHVRQLNKTAFKRMHAALAVEHPGEFVAIKDGKFLGSHTNKKELRARYKDRDVLIEKVTMTLTGDIQLGGPTAISLGSKSR